MLLSEITMKVGTWESFLQSFVRNNVPTVLILVGFLLIVPYAISTRKASRRRRELNKYEFEHRTGGGVVQFKTFEDAEEHQRKRARAGPSGCAGGLLIVGVTMAFLGGVLVVVRILSRL